MWWSVYGDESPTVWVCIEHGFLTILPSESACRFYNQGLPPMFRMRPPFKTPASSSPRPSTCDRPHPFQYTQTDGTHVSPWLLTWARAATAAAVGRSTCLTLRASMVAKRFGECSCV